MRLGENHDSGHIYLHFLWVFIIHQRWAFRQPRHGCVEMFAACLRCDSGCVCILFACFMHCPFTRSAQVVALCRPTVFMFVVSHFYLRDHLALCYCLCWTQAVSGHKGGHSLHHPFVSHKYLLSSWRISVSTAHSSVVAMSVSMPLSSCVRMPFASSVAWFGVLSTSPSSNSHLCAST